MMRCRCCLPLPPLHPPTSRVAHASLLAVWWQGDTKDHERLTEKLIAFKEEGEARLRAKQKAEAEAARKAEAERVERGRWASECGAAHGAGQRMGVWAGHAKRDDRRRTVPPCP